MVNGFQVQCLQVDQRIKLTSTGPNVFGISSEVPEGCSVDQAVFVSRHGSRYPDPSAYAQWQNLSSKVRSQMGINLTLTCYPDPPSQIQDSRKRARISFFLGACVEQPNSAAVTDLPHGLQRAV